jgi:hypothetical protein
MVLVGVCRMQRAIGTGTSLYPDIYYPAGRAYTSLPSKKMSVMEVGAEMT